jgi:hypothetical protein
MLNRMNVMRIILQMLQTKNLKTYQIKARFLKTLSQSSLNFFKELMNF